VLLGRTPLYSPPADGVRRRHFARWLARRFVREPLDDGVEYGVADPIRRTLATRPATIHALREVRIFHLAGAPPYGVQLIFIVDERDREQLSGSLVDVVAAVREEFEDGVAELLDWDVLSEETISVSEYSASDQVFFEPKQGQEFIPG
jgi:hypothetical protein